MLAKLLVKFVLYMNKVLFQMTQFKDGLRKLSAKILALKMMLAVDDHHL